MSLLDSLDRRFRAIDERSRELLALIDDAELFTRPRQLENSMMPFSCGEFILRSAAMVERTFGGITTRLWDDPFEWTLPEKLSTKSLIIEYLDEVEATRVKGFTFMANDADLAREIPAPERLMPLSDILLETIALAEHYQGRAFALFQLSSDKPLPRL